MPDDVRSLTVLLDAWIVGAFWLLLMVIAVFRVVAILRPEEPTRGQ